MNVLRRRGYVAKVEFDGHDRVLVGRVLGIDDVVGFHGDSVAILDKAFAIALDDYQAACAALGRPAQRSHSGELRLRMSTKTHRVAAMAAEARGMSLNGWIEEAIRRTGRLDLGGV